MLKILSLIFLQITHNGEHIKNTKKNLKILFFDGAE
jgi:hypothetical protein